MNMHTKIGNIHVVCFQWGTRYPAVYVNNLKNMVKRHLSVPHVFHCLTDSEAGIDRDVVTHPIPNMEIPGNWRKLSTFQDNFLQLNGEFILYIDLDMIIMGELDFALEHPEHTFVITKHWSKTGTRANSCIYRLKVGAHTEVWNKFIASPQTFIDQHYGKNKLFGDQKWIDYMFDSFHFFPEGKVVSFKKHCHAKGHRILGLNTARFGKAKVPPGASVISFHGDPLPPDVMNSSYKNWRHAPFINDHWHSCT
jgi:hypothetical protein